jgi:hypothetical protein
MEFAEIICSAAKIAGRYRRNILCNGLRQWKSVIVLKQYQDMCLSEYE